MKENAGSDRSWVWQCMDFSEEKNDVAVLAIRFANSENAQKFKDAFEDAKAANVGKFDDSKEASVTKADAKAKQESEANTEVQKQDDEEKSV